MSSLPTSRVLDGVMNLLNSNMNTNLNTDYLPARSTRGRTLIQPSNPLYSIQSSTFLIDYSEDENNIDVYADIAGTDKKDINIDVFNDKLTITVERKRSNDNCIITELNYGKLSRTIPLGICVTKKETLSVEYKNGILHVRICKFFEEQNRFSVPMGDIKEN